jgi:aryl-alcohol dehydrogenase-like predicted oxidoreductase
MLTGDQLSSRWDKARLDDLLEGMSRIEFMVPFTIAEPALDTTIIGTKDVNHLRENIAAASKGPLPGKPCGRSQAAPRRKRINPSLIKTVSRQS